VLRIAPCPHRPPCPGCPRYGEPGIDPRARTALAHLAAEAGLPKPIIHEGAALGFRRRARLAVRGRANAPRIGIFQASSHRIVAVPRCPIQHPRVNEVAGALREAIRERGLAPYADAPHKGVVRYVQIALDDRDRAQVVVVTNGSASEPVAGLLEPLRERLGAALHSLWWNGNPDRTNTILGPGWECLHGPPLLELDVAGARVYFPPGAFGQSHHELAGRIAARVRAWVPDGAGVGEFYAGTGSIGLGLLERAAFVRFNERSEDALRGLEAGIAAWPDPVRARAAVSPGRAGARLDTREDCDVVIVDPPRKGLDAELLTSLCDEPNGALVYVSCGWPAFVAECARLRAAGWRLVDLEAYALFPFTEHVETLARFTADPGAAPRAATLRP